MPFAMSSLIPVVGMRPRICRCKQPINSPYGNFALGFVVSEATFTRVEGWMVPCRSVGGRIRRRLAPSDGQAACIGHPMFFTPAGWFCGVAFLTRALAEALMIMGHSRGVYIVGRTA